VYKKQSFFCRIFFVFLLIFFSYISSSIPINLSVNPFKAYYLCFNSNSLLEDYIQNSANDCLPSLHVPSVLSTPSFYWGREIQSVVDNGFFAREKKPSFYIYAQQKKEFLSVGIIGEIDVKYLKTDLIKRHEETIPHKVEVYVENLKMQMASFEPILLGYQASESIDDLVTKFMQNLPTYAYFTNDDVRHAIWVIDKDKSVEQISNLFSQVKHCYILDGHHRVASLCKIYDDILQYQKNGIQIPPNLKNLMYCKVALFPSHKIRILAYNRILKNIPQLSEDDFLKTLEKSFTIESVVHFNESSLKQGVIGMYFKNEWFHLSPKKEFLLDNSLADNLDLSLINNYLVKPIAKKYNIKKSDMLEYVNSSVSCSELESRCESTNAKAAFVFNPISFETLSSVVNFGHMLPEKSTWIEPKLNL